MPEPIKTIDLKYPIQQGQETITHLEFMRRPKAKDLKGLPVNLGFDELMTILGRLTGHPPSVLGELDFDDLMVAVEVVTDFLPGGLQTGATA
jgi:hypothetical protein